MLWIDLQTWVHSELEKPIEECGIQNGEREEGKTEGKEQEGTGKDEEDMWEAEYLDVLFFWIYL